MYEDNHKKLQDVGVSGFETNEVEQRLESLRAVVQDTRFTLIQNILGHPAQEPSLKELAYVNPDKSKSTIREHLGKLVDYGIVEKTELRKERRTRDLPHQFYQLTGGGHKFLKEQGLLGAEKTLQELYSRVEKPEHIVRYEEAPRPRKGDTSESQADERLLQP
jgi:DNA-binding transcriptional ArsR family regulator